MADVKNCNVGLFVGNLVDFKWENDGEYYLCELNIPYNNTRTDVVMVRVPSKVYEPSGNSTTNPVVYVKGVIKSERIQNADLTKSTWSVYVDAEEMVEISDGSEDLSRFRYLNRVYIYCKMYRAYLHETQSKHKVCSVASNLLDKGEDLNRITVIFWDKEAESICVKRSGTVLRVCGKLETRNWNYTKDNGDSILVTECVSQDYNIVKEN